MKLTVWQRLDVAARQITPTLLTLAVVMLALVPLHLPDIAPVMPWLALIAVYYWSLHRPDLMPPIAVFAIGTFADLAAGTALGVGVLILLLVHYAAVSQRRFFNSRGFGVVWSGFATIALGACALSWLLNAMLAGMLVDPGPVVFQFLTTVAAYPPLTWLFARVQRSLLQ